MGLKLRLGTRGSKLALWQAKHVAGLIKGSEPDSTVELEIIKTKGDKILDVPLAKVGGKGLFVKEIEQALLEKRVDLAVHSMKDLPAELPDGLHIAAILERADHRDVLLSRKGDLKGLPAGATVGTSSLRRKAQLLFHRPDLKVSDLRGNVDTRIRRLDDGDYDAIILAAAGVDRLGYQEYVTERLDEPWLCAGAQGALAIECRVDDAKANELLARFDHEDTRVCAMTERDLLARLGGSCQIPIAALAQRKGEKLELDALVAHPDGQPMYRAQAGGALDDWQKIAEKVATALLAQGAQPLLESLIEQG